MATITTPDELLEQAGVTGQDVLIEAACRLFDAGRLSLWGAAQLAALTRTQMEDALLDRKIAIYRPTVEDLEKEMATLDAMRRQREAVAG